MQASIIVPRKDAAGQRIPDARPQFLLARIEVAVVLVQRAGHTERHRTLNGILTHDVRQPLAVTGRSLLPLFGLILPLINSRGETSLDVAQRVYHCLEVEMGSLPLS